MTGSSRTKVELEVIASIGRQVDDQQELERW